MQALYSYLLDADEDLADGLDLRERFTARQHITARVLRVETGRCALEPLLACVGHGPGLLILDGVLAVDTSVASRTMSELLGVGDLLQPTPGHLDDLLERVETWRALCECRVALLDGDFAERMRPWPPIAHVLLRRTERRAEDLGVLRAISCEPRLEVRLVLLLWHLAGRWGRVEPAGIHLALPLTHRLLGQLVAAERPSISHALGRLSDAGLVQGGAGDFHLHGSLAAQLRALSRAPRHRGVRPPVRALP
ncbi:MAG TPA: helix-turn-helix domain-containing protein [Solirubrobacteraceae bacterium]|nr:helix-turn-helix domain-containing protein [Solirubrobacteraceae bacterium]